MRRLLAPRSVAVVGASERPGSYGGEALLNLGRFGFSGRVHAVNPRRRQVHGFDCVPSLADLTDTVDAVVVAVPAAEAVGVVEQAGALGAGGAVVFAAGFAEARDGAGLQSALAAAARTHGLPVCGPNGNGIVSLRERVALWGDQVHPAPAGSVALVTQSGNIAVNALAARRGLRLHTVVSCGNAAVLAPEDFVAAVARLDGVGAVALYLESDGDGRRWCDALAACADAGVGVAVLKAGASAAGAAAAQAHTGAVAGDQRVARAFFEACGAAWAEDPHDLLELAKALAAGRRTRGTGTRLGVMTCSGGDSSVAADLADDMDLPLPPLSETTRRELAAVLPAAATVQNPLDYTSLLWDEPDALARAVAAFRADPAIDRLLVLYDEPAGLDGDAATSWAAVLDAIRAGARPPGAPVAVASTLPELLADATAGALAADGLPALAGLRTGLRAMAALGAQGGGSGRIAAIRAAAGAPAAGGLEWLAEHEAKALLGTGLVPRGRVVYDADAAAAAAAELGGEVAVKASGRGLRHKTELGGVRLGLSDPEAVRADARELLTLAGAVLVEQMAPPGAELIVAVRTDTLVPVLVVGLGGILAEAIDDAAVLPLPVDGADVEAALRGLRGARALIGADLSAAAALATRATRVALERGLALLELNPVIAGEQSALAVDAIAAVPARVKQGVLA
jgi:acetate---CoA ligase (ADP-forming)